jgi:MiaB/RimO family radical SAM methylthiotransferase
MTSGKKCYVNYLGCEKRKLDTQRILNYLIKNEYEYTSVIPEADVIIFLTCGFIKKYEDWSITKMEKIYNQKSPFTKFIVGGCLPAINPERFQAYPDIIQIQARELEQLDIILKSPILMKNISDPNLTIFDEIEKHYSPELLHTPARDEYEHAKEGFKIRISYGCLSNCAYCVTKLAEKHLSSKSLEVIQHEFEIGLAQHLDSFFVTGGDTGAYGLDMNSSIVNLLKMFFSYPNSYRIHFHDFGVQWLHRYISELIPIFKSNQQKLGCACFPIQSGSDHILKLMRRPYSIVDIQKDLLSLKKEVPSFKIGTHIIVGFPGETEADFQATLDLLQNIPFDFLNVFLYTDHIRADSFHFSLKVPIDEIKNRFQRIVAWFDAKHSYSNEIS